MVVSSNTYTFYYTLIATSPWLASKRIEDLRQVLHPKPSKHIYPQRQVYRKRLGTPLNSNTLQALPMFKPSPVRQRRPSFMFDISSNDFK